MPPLRVAVIGAGAFGRNHLRVYRELEQAHPELVHLAALVEPDATRRTTVAATCNIPAFATIDDLLAAQLHLDAASICVPTLHHAAVAEQLLLAHLDLLIEKPFAATLAEADHLISLARDRDRILAVGHLERFNPAVTATVRALNHPMFFEAHRLSIFTPRSLDVDVVLDLMIHDLDIVLALTNSPIREVRAVGLPVLSRNTDIANVRIEFESGCVANFTASRVSTEQVRKLRLFQPHQYLSLDFARQELLTINVDPATIEHLQTLSSLPHPPPPQPASPQPACSQPASSQPASPQPASLAAGAETPLPSSTSAPATTSAHPSLPTEPPTLAPVVHPTAGLSLTRADIPKGEPLRLELENFLHAVRTRTQPRVPAEAGRAALSLALAINEQIAIHAHRSGLLHLPPQGNQANPLPAPHR